MYSRRENIFLRFYFGFTTEKSSGASFEKENKTKQKHFKKKKKLDFNGVLNCNLI